MRSSSDLNENITCQPFLKWAGGKRWFVRNHLQIAPSQFNHYFEPFLGGASMYFALRPRTATLSDFNANLINCYIQIREAPKVVHTFLVDHHFKHCKDYYYQIRASRFEDPIERAAQFIYLNRTCWNALYRVNLKGEFNVPIGTKTNVLLDTDNFDNISNILNNAQILSCDFEETINKASNNDFIFVDPPYTVKHNNNGQVTTCPYFA